MPNNTIYGPNPVVEGNVKRAPAPMYEGHKMISRARKNERSQNVLRNFGFLDQIDPLRDTPNPSRHYFDLKNGKVTHRKTVIAGFRRRFPSRAT